MFSVLKVHKNSGLSKQRCNTKVFNREPKCLKIVRSTGSLSILHILLLPLSIASLCFQELKAAKDLQKQQKTWMGTAQLNPKWQLFIKSMNPSIFTQLILSTFCSIYSKDFTVFPSKLDFFLLIYVSLLTSLLLPPVLCQLCLINFLTTIQRLIGEKNLLQFSSEKINCLFHG